MFRCWRSMNEDDENGQRQFWKEFPGKSKLLWLSRTWSQCTVICCHLLLVLFGTMNWLCNAADCPTTLTCSPMCAASTVDCPIKLKRLSHSSPMCSQLVIVQQNGQSGHLIRNSRQMPHYSPIILPTQPCPQNRHLLKWILTGGGRGRSPDGRRGEAQTGTFSAQTIFSLPWTPSTLQKYCLGHLQPCSLLLSQRVHHTIQIDKAVLGVPA